MKIRYSSILFIVSLLTTNLYSQCPGDPATESNGVINITGTCLPTEYQIGCHCYDKLIIDWLYGFDNKFFNWPPSIELPKGGGGKGSGDNSKKPTTDNCASAWADCQKDAEDRYSLCMAKKMLETSLTKIYKNKSCYPERDEGLMNSIELMTVNAYRCSAKDFYNDSKSSQKCRVLWRRLASKECIFGVPENTVSTQENMSFSFDLAGFGQLG